MVKSIRRNFVCDFYKFIIFLYFTINYLLVKSCFIRTDIYWEIYIIFTVIFRYVNLYKFYYFLLYFTINYLLVKSCFIRTDIYWELYWIFFSTFIFFYSRYVWSKSFNVRVTNSKKRKEKKHILFFFFFLYLFPLISQ